MFVIGTFMTGFILWRVSSSNNSRSNEQESQQPSAKSSSSSPTTDLEAISLKPTDVTTLRLPSGIRNISTRMNKSNSCVLSAGHVYAVAGIRKELYIWTMKDGVLVKYCNAQKKILS